MLGGDYCAATLRLNHSQLPTPQTVTFIAPTTSADPLTGVRPAFALDDPLRQSLHDQCHGQLPSHMVPDAILTLDFMPLADLFSGEVDFKVLRRIFSQLSLTNLDLLRRRQGPALSRPLNKIEKKIRDILSEAAGVPADAILKTTTTIELGIDSLIAVSLSFRLKAAGLMVPPHVVLAGPSLEMLAKSCQLEREGAIEGNVTTRTVSDEVRSSIEAHFDGSTIEAVLPCLPLQEGLVALSLNSVSPIYVNHFIMRLNDVDVPRLKDATDATITANAILRTCFFVGAKNVVQVILKDSSLTSPWRTVEAKDGEDALAILRAGLNNVGQEIVRALERRPPLCLSLCSGSDGSKYFCLSMHHSLYDGEDQCL
jgi:hypothetical protein